MWRENAVSIACRGARSPRLGRGAEPRVPRWALGSAGSASAGAALRDPRQHRGPVRECRFGNAGCSAWRASVLHRAGVA